MTILASAGPGEIRAAAVRDGRLVDYTLTRPGDSALSVGDVLRGRITARRPALAGAFVTFGSGDDGFLPDSAGGAAVCEGDVLGVRVTRAPQGGKGPRVAVDADAPGGSLGLLRPGPDAVQRLAARHPRAPVLIDDRRELARLRPLLGQRISFSNSVFDDDVQSEIEGLAARQVTLAEGGRFSIHPTPGLVVIDADLGAGASARQSKTHSHAAFNSRIIPEIARQIRLRELGGGIAVDLAGLSPRRRAALGPLLAQALADDPAGARFLGFSALGLAEILRPRIETPLHERLGTPHAAALDALRALARNCATVPSRRPAIAVGAAVAQALRQDGPARADLARRVGADLILRVDVSLPPLFWRLEEE